MDMTTRSLTTITPTPVLIESNDRVSIDGVGTLFLPADRTHTSGLHIVTKREAFDYLDKQKSTEVREIAGNVARFRQALRDKNWPLLKRVHEDAWKYIPHMPGEKVTWPSLNWKRAGFAYSEFMGNLLHKAQFILWCSTTDGTPHPGLYCPDWEVALYAVVGMDGLRRCAKPGCETEIFIPKQDTQKCCCPEHANTLRVANWYAEHGRPHKKKIGKTLRD